MMDSNISKNTLGNDNTIVGRDYEVNNYTVNNYTINDTNIRDEYHSNYVLNRIKRLKQYFVKTNSYSQILKKIKNHHINGVEVIGCAGIGKTSMSIMVANYFMEEQGYDYMWVTKPNESDLKKIWSLINEDYDKKEVIIIDDFLGHNQLNNSSSYLECVEQLLKDVEEYENKIFVINSRKTILQNVKTISKKIESIIRSSFSVVDLEKWGNKDDPSGVKEKMDIFCAYCKKYNILGNVKNLLDDKKWDYSFLEYIIQHKNFTPLIINNTIKECSQMEMDLYKKIFRKNLDNPEEIWEGEINVLNDIAKQYLYVLYSLDSGFIDKKIVDECFDRYISNMEKLPDISPKDINYCIDSLIVYDDNKIDFVHPSLADYLANKITYNEKDNLIKSAVYLEQVQKLDVEKNFIREMMRYDGIELPAIFNLKVLPIKYKLWNQNYMGFNSSTLIQFIRYIYELNIQDNLYQDLIIEALEIILKGDVFSYLHCSNYIIDVFKMNYNFNKILQNDGYVKQLFQYATVDNIDILIKKVVKEEDNGFNFDTMDDFIQEKILDVLEMLGTETVENWMVENAKSYIEDVIDEWGDDVDEDEYNDIVDDIIERLREDLDSEVGRAEIEEKVDKWKLFGEKIDVDEMEYIDYVDISQWVQDEIYDMVINCYNNR